MLRVRAVVRPQLLPAEFRTASQQPERCGTVILRDAWQQYSLLSPAGQAQLAADLVRPPTSFFYDSPDGQFRIHYSTTGGHAVPAADSNANGVPDYVEKLARYADSSWRHEVNRYAYLPPPSDGGAGGNSAYDIYCQSIGAYGYCQPEQAGPQPWNDYTSYIVVHSTFAGFPDNTDPDGHQAGAAKATVAHEFQHACQFAYDVGENGSWMEMTATWMEDEVFDPVNDNYNYLPSFFSQPQASLFAVNPYGAFVWPRQLAEVHGAPLIEAIWDACISSSALIAIDSLLSGLGTSRDRAFAEFSAWNWITNVRDDGAHYEEGAAYPLIAVMRTHSTLPVPVQSSSQPPGGMGSNYVRFVTDQVPTGAPLTVSFDGEDGYAWAARIVARDPGGQFETFPLALDGLSAGKVSLHDASAYSHVALVVSLLTVSGGANYQYSACTGATSPGPLSPADLSTAYLPVQLEWEAIPGAISYRYQVDEDSLFGSPEVDAVTPDYRGLVRGLAQGTLHYWRISVTDACGESSFGAARRFTAACGIALTGDVDAGGSVTSADVIRMVNHVFKGGPPPLPQPEAGDVDCSGQLTSADIVKLVNYTFKAGPAPCNACIIL